MGQPAAPILIVNDDEAVSEALRHLLEGQGFSVQTAADGWDAMTQLFNGLRPGLIVLDLMMPVMDGYEFREQQLRIPEFADIPVIVMSAVFDVRSEAIRLLDARAYLEVPFDPRTLEQAVSRHYR